MSGLHATVSQSFATTASQEYELSFYVGAATSPSATIHVALSGASTLLEQTLTASAPTTNIEWTKYTFRFTADSTTTTLSFNDLSSGDDNASFVDDESVIAVPEPSSLVMAGLGGLALAGVSLRRRAA